MPITQREIDEGDRFYFEKPGEVTVLVGPCSGMAWTGATIPLDGRHYRCAGRIILPSGRELFANLPLRTHTFDFLEVELVRCQVGDTWYLMDEPELFEALGLSRKQVTPYKWIPDRPLDWHRKGPYSIK